MRVANMKIEISNLIQKKSTTKILSTRTKMQRRVRQVPSSKITTAEKTRSLSHKFRQKKKNNKTLKLRILIMNVKIEEVAVKSTKNVTMYKKTK
jgi:predicted  nucleic acid-binding Zn-ribbon protein